jgi:sigma-B regulation protein RsbU (phosphoserine phosphatase)
VSLRWIMAGATCALMTALMMALGFLAERNLRRVMTAETEARLSLQAQNLALAGSSALLSDFPELTLNPMAKTMIERQPEIAFVTVVSPDGRIVGDAELQRIGQRFVAPAALEPEGRSHPGSRARLLANRTLIVASAPVQVVNGRSLGTAYVGYRRGHIDEQVDHMRRTGLLWLAAFLLVGGLATYVMMWRFLRPIQAVRAGIERIGRGDFHQPVLLDDPTEFGMLADALNTMSWELTVARDNLVETERLSHEMELAQSIQQSLLPSARLRSGAFTFDGAQRAATEVGGDYFDSFELPDGRIAVAIADVAGKGLGGCMVTSMVSALLKAYSVIHSSPSDLLGALDHCLAGLLPRATFVTMFYAVVDPGSGEMVYASAGHNPSMLYRRRDGSVLRLNNHGAPLCLVRGDRVRRTLSDSSIRLEPGDVLLQTTDGVNEAFDPLGAEQFGFDRVEEVLQRAAPEGADAVLTALRKALDDWRQSEPFTDDETVLIIARDPAPVDEVRSDGEAPAALVAEALASGHALRLRAELDALDGLEPWLHGLPEVSEFDERSFRALHLALYELCANIVEHGYRNQSAEDFMVWWIASRRHFLIIDCGTPFVPAPWLPADYANPEIRRRGRGHGLDIVHRLASVKFYPATPEGNITLLTPREHAARTPEEVAQ